LLYGIERIRGIRTVGESAAFRTETAESLIKHREISISVN
jgi:hypothetical protein